MMLGCSYEYLTQQLGLTDKLTAEMEIDHIIPISQYDLNDPHDVVRACNWRNLQLLTHEENREKGMKLPDKRTLDRLTPLWPRAWWPEQVPEEIRWEVLTPAGQEEYWRVFNKSIV